MEILVIDLNVCRPKLRNVNIQQNVVIFEIMKRKEILRPNQSEKYCILWATDSVQTYFFVKLCSFRRGVRLRSFRTS